MGKDSMTGRQDLLFTGPVSGGGLVLHSWVATMGHPGADKTSGGQVTG